MRMGLVRCVALLAVMLAVAGCGVVPARRGAPMAAADVRSGGVGAEDVFPIMSWELPPRTQEFSDPRHGLGTLADCGFSVAGFVRPGQLAACREHHLRAIVCPAAGILKWGQMTDEQIDRAVRELVAEAHGDPAVIGYFITDEPGAPEFAALGKAVAAVHKYAPGKLAYINLFPNYATLGAPNISQLGTASYHEYLERFVAEVKPQFLSYDNYQVQYSGDLKNAGAAESYYRNLVEVRAVAQEHGLPFWNIVGSNQIVAGMPPPSPADLLMQAYTTLAAGGQGLTWYTYYSGGYEYAAVDKAGNRTATWSYLRLVNDQVKALGPIVRTLKSTGVYFTEPAPASGLAKLPGKWVESVAGGAVMVGEFSGTEDSRWAMVVNLNLRESVSLKIRWAATVRGVRGVSAVDGSMEALPKDSVWLAAGQGVLVRLDVAGAASRAGS
jgi:hypothetical protein